MLMSKFAMLYNVWDLEKKISIYESSVQTLIWKNVIYLPRDTLYKGVRMDRIERTVKGLLKVNA